MDPSSDARDQTAPVQPPSPRRTRRNRSPQARQTPLNDRQQRYLEVLYELDQQAEREQNRRWHQHLRRDPAEQWRWIPYDTDHPTAGPTPAQQLLAQHGVQDPGAGSTLAALTRRGLIETRRTPVEFPTGVAAQVQIRLTKSGRSTARAARPASADGGGEQLPGWLNQALAIVAQAESNGVPKPRIGRVAARQLGGYGYIEEASAWSYRVTERGRTYLAQLRRGQM